MTWTAPRTWENEELINQDQLNTHVRDNLLALKTPPQDEDTEDWQSGADKSTTSTSFVDVDGATLSLELTTTGGNILVTVRTLVFGSTAQEAYFDLSVDGTRQGQAAGLCQVSLTTSQTTLISFCHWVRGKVADTYTINLMWRTSTGTLTMVAGGSSDKPEQQFFAMELG